MEQKRSTYEMKRYEHVSRTKTQNLAYCGLFVALIVVGTFIKIPVPVVPFTLQFLFTMLAGNLLGGKLGASCVGTYMLLGLLGAPVFAEGGGLWYLAKPSFGYIIGFCIASYATGKMIEKFGKLEIKKLFLVNLLGLFIVYAMGMVYYYVVCNFVIHTPISLGALFLYCFLVAVPGDLLLCILAAFLTKRIRPLMK